MAKIKIIPNSPKNPYKSLISGYKKHNKTPLTPNEIYNRYQTIISHGTSSIIQKTPLIKDGFIQN